MNRIFKLIRNRSSGLCAVVSELKTSCRKGRVQASSGSLKLAAAAVLLAGSGSALSLPNDQSDVWWATNVNQGDKSDAFTIHTYEYRNDSQYSHLNTNFYLGGSSVARTYVNLTIHAPTSTSPRDYWTIFLQDSRGKDLTHAQRDLMANNTSVLAQHSFGLAQQMIAVENLTIDGSGLSSDNFKIGVNHYEDWKGSKQPSELFVQGLHEEDGTVSANAHYGMGEEAVEVFRTYGLLGAEASGNGVIVDGLYYGSGGVAISTTPGNAGFWMLSYLKEVELLEGKRFTMTDAGGKTFLARLTGAGNVNYVGENASASEISLLRFEDLYPQMAGSSVANGEANDYTGTTTISRYTVNASRGDAFGSQSTADLTLSESRLNLLRNEALVKVQNLALTDSVLHYADNRDRTLTVENALSVSGDLHLAGHGSLTLTADTMTVAEDGFIFRNGANDKDGKLSSVALEANTLHLSNAEAFEEDAALTLTVNERFVIDDGESAVFSKAVASDENGFDFVLDGADLTLGSQTIAARETQLLNGSRLATSASYYGQQLGNSIVFSDDAELAINGSGSWMLSGLTLSAVDKDTAGKSDALLRLSAGSSENTITFSNVKNSGFTGTVLFENAHYALASAQDDEVFSKAALGLGTGSRIEFGGETSRTLSSLYWQGGELDLSEFIFSQTDAAAAALKVGRIDISGSAGSIRLDLHQFSGGLQGAKPQTGNFSLEYDNGTFIHTIIEAENNPGALPTLIAENFSGSDHTAIYKGVNEEDAATGYWNFGLMEGTEAQPGIALGYRLNSLELHNSEENALLLKGGTAESEHTLTAQVTGKGALLIEGTVHLAPSQANSFTESVITTKTDALLTTGPVSHALGTGNLLKLGDSSGLEIAEGSTGIVETLSSVTLGQNAWIDLKGNTLELSGGHSIFANGTQLMGEASARFALTQTGSAEILDLDVIQGFSGVFDWAEGATGTLTLSDQDDTLTSGRFVGHNGLGGLDLKLDLNANLDGLSLQGLDLLVTGGHSLTATSETARQSLNGSRLTLSDGARLKTEVSGLRLEGLHAESGSTLDVKLDFTADAPALIATGDVTIDQGSTIAVTPAGTSVDGAFVLLHDEASFAGIVQAGGALSAAEVNLTGVENFAFTLEENGNTVGHAYLENGLQLAQNGNNLGLAYRISQLDLSGDLKLSGLGASDRTLSAQLTGEGGVTVEGVLTFTNNDSRVGHVNVNASGDLTLAGDLTLTGSSSWLGTLSGDKTVTLTDQAGLTIGTNADLFGYSGTLAVTDGSRVTVNTLTQGTLDKTTFALDGNSTIEVASNYSFFSSVKRADDAQTGGTLKITAANVFFGKDTQEGGISRIEIANAGSVLKTYGSIDTIASTGEGVNVSVSGAGELRLLGDFQPVTLTTARTDFSHFTGTLRLASSLYGSEVTLDTTGLTAAQTATAKTAIVGESGSTIRFTGDQSVQVKSLTLNGGTLRFDAGEGMIDIRESGAGIGTGKLILSADRIADTFALDKPLLDQDEGLFDGLVHSEWGGLFHSNLTYAIDPASGTTQVSANEFTTVLSEDGVTRTFSTTFGIDTEKRTLGATSRLTALDHRGKAILSLNAGESTEETPDLEVRLTGTGAFSKTDTADVILAATQGSDFSGSFDVTGGRLTLSGATDVYSGSTVSVGENAAVAFDSRQIVTLNASGEVVVADAGLGLTGENHFTDGRLSGSGNVNVEKGSTVDVTTTGNLFDDFQGSLVLNQSSTALFTAANADLSLDRLAGTGSAILRSGDFRLSKNTFAGAFDLNDAAQLTLEGGSEAATVFDAFRLTGTGTITASDRVHVDGSAFISTSTSPNAFEGTWRVLEDSALTLAFGAGETVTDSEYKIEKGGTLELSFTDDVHGYVNLGSVNANAERSGTLILRGPQHLETDSIPDVISSASQQTKGVHVEEIQLLEGVVYHAGTPADLGLTTHIDEESRLILDSRMSTGAEKTFNLSTVLLDHLGESVGHTAFTGSGLIEILMPVGGFDFVFHSASATEEQVHIAADRLFGDANEGFTGTLHLTGGTYVHHDYDNIFFEHIGDFSLGEGAVVKVADHDSLTLPMLSFRPHEEVAGSVDTRAPMLDLTDFNGIVEDEGGKTFRPAMNVDKLVVESEAQIRLDPEKWITSGWGNPAEGGNVLDLDASTKDALPSNFVQLIKADEVTGEANIALYDQNGNPITDGVTTTHTRNGAEVAKGHWGYRARLIKEEGSVDGKDYTPGVYVGYGIYELELLGDLKNAFLFDGTSSEDSTFDGRITGAGALEINGDVRWSNASNDFTGIVTVDKDSRLALTGGSWILGGYVKANASPIELRLDTGAELALEMTQNRERAAITASNDSIVNLGSSSTLFLAGKSTFASKSLIKGDSTSTLIVDGDVRFEDADTQLQNFDGSLRLSQKDVTLTLAGDGKELQLNLADVASGEPSPLATSSEARVILERDARIGTSGTFTGTWVVGSEHQLTIDKTSRMNALSSVELQAGARLDVSDRTNGADFKNLSMLQGSEVVLGTFAIGAEGIDAGLTLDRLDVQEASSLSVTINPEEIQHDALMRLDNEGGLVTNVITAGEVSGFEHLVVEINDETDLDRQASLKDAQGNTIGSVQYGAQLVSTDDSAALSIGVQTKAEAVTLWGELVLEGTRDSEVTDDTRLSLTIQEADGRRGEGTVRIDTGRLALAGSNSYGSLQVGQDAHVVLEARQTLTGKNSVFAGEISDAGAAGGTPLLRLDEGAEVLAKGALSGLASGVTLGAGSTLALEGSLFDPTFGPTDSGRLIETIDLEATAQLSLKDIAGTLDSVKAAEGAVLNLTLSQAALTVNTDVYSTFGTSVIGEGSTLLVEGSADNPESFVSSGSVSIAQGAHLGFVIADANQPLAINPFEKISGSGTVEVRLVNDESSASPQQLSFRSSTDVKDFTGSLLLTNAHFAFGRDADVSNTAVAEGVTRLVAGENSIFEVVGGSRVKDLVMTTGSTLDLSHPGSSAKPGLHHNRIETSRLEFEVGSSVRIDTNTLEAVAGLPDLKTGDTTENGSLVDGQFDLIGTLVKTEAAETNHFVQVATGEVIGAEHALVVDENGQAISAGHYGISIVAEGHNVARFEGALQLVGSKEGAWLGQGVAAIDLLHDTLLTTDGEYDIHAALRGGEDVTLTQTNGTVSLSNGNGAFAGDVVVAGGELRLLASGALGSSLIPRSLTVTDGGLLSVGSKDRSAVEQDVRSFAVREGGTLRLEGGSTFGLVQGSGFVSGRVEGDGTSLLRLTDSTLAIALDTAQLSNTVWAMDEQSAITVENTAAATLKTTDAKFQGGSLIKTGKGQLSFEKGTISSDTLLDLREGLTDFIGWNETDESLLHSDDDLSLGGLIVREDASFNWTGTRLHASQVRNAGRISLVADTSSDSAFVTRTLDGDYVGEGGTIALRAELGSDDRDETGALTTGVTSDALIVRGAASGSVVFSVEVLNAQLDRGAEERMVLLHADSNEGLVSELESGPIESGGYTYTLSNFTDDSGALDVVLTSFAEDGSRNVSPDRGAFYGAASAGSLFGLSLHDKLGLRPYLDPISSEVCSSALWSHGTTAHERSRDDTGSVGVKTERSVMLLGGDIVRFAPDMGGIVHAGLFAGTGDMDVSASGSLSHSSANIDGWTMGLYLGWNAAEGLDGPSLDSTGPYAALWVQHSSLKSVFRNNQGATTVRGSGWSASLEAGWQLPALATPLGAVTFEPHFQATWYGLKWDDFYAGAQVRLTGEGQVETRTGLRTTFAPVADILMPYVELDWVHRTRAWGSVVNNELVSHQAGAGNTFEGSAGVEFRLGRDLTGLGEFRWREGAQGYQDREAAFSLRWRF